MITNCEILDKVFYILVNVVFATYINHCSNKRLQKHTIRFSLYNQIQIEALKKTYKLLTSFKFITIQIKENDKKDYDFYKSISDKWLMSFLELTNTLSQEKYIYPKEIKIAYTNTIDELKILQNYLIDNAKLKENFETHFDGLEYYQTLKNEVEQDNVIELMNKMQNNKNDNLFVSVIEKVEILRNKIESEFEKIQ